MRDDQGDIYNQTGLIFAMLSELGRSLNFTYVVVTPQDGEYGVKRDGKWTGIVKMIEDEEVFMGAAALTISADRQEVVDFSIPFDLQPYTIMFRRPQELSKALEFIRKSQPVAQDGRVPQEIKTFCSRLKGPSGNPNLLLTTLGIS